MDERAALLQLLDRLSAGAPGNESWRFETLHRIQARLAELGVTVIVELPADPGRPSPGSGRRRRRRARMERLFTPAGHAWASRSPISSGAPRLDAAARAGGVWW